ncbi:cysteine hydrolase family protein [Sunxiuqinia sp. A32]|uniref:cysteine hydrolase family protein n=1 Tax=Sunxiuqinia sp. A32 TaxID=3461496 RepID=UPI004046553D
MKALLIIDMQKGSFIPKTPRYDAVNVIDRINQLSSYFRENNYPVIFIQHDGSRFDCYVPGTEEWEIIPSLIREGGDYVVSKTANDAFYRSKLDAVLKKLEVSRLVITGCATDFCVDSTVRSALNHDYYTTVISDAHTTADRPHLNADKIIEHYNWIWKEMIPTEGIIEVKSYNSFVHKK